MSLRLKTTMSPEEHRHNDIEILQRITRVETIITGQAESLKNHVAEEPHQWLRIYKAIEAQGEKFQSELKGIRNEIEALHIARSKEKGFFAGIVFILTSAGAIIGAIWNRMWHA